MIKINFSILIILSLLFSYQVFASNYFVSHSSTSTDWTAERDLINPCIVEIAFDSTQAGDTVFFCGNMYTVPPRNTVNWLSGYYNPVNSGTKNQLIAFMAFPDETPLFNGTSGGSVDKDRNDYYDFATLFGINTMYKPSKHKLL